MRFETKHAKKNERTMLSDLECGEVFKFVDSSYTGLLIRDNEGGFVTLQEDGQLLINCNDDPNRSCEVLGRIASVEVVPK